MPISIYPPTLQSSQPAFIYTVREYPINFTLQSITKFSEIGHIQIRVVRQTNNRSIVNINKYPDGVIYKTPKDIKDLRKGQYQVNIVNIDDDTDLMETWQPGTLYKIQLRFGTTGIYSSLGDFTTWKKQQIDNQTFSEWSTVMIIKPIHKPQVEIENNHINIDSIITQKIENNLAPYITGIFSLDVNDKEIVDQYKFDLFKGKKDEIESDDLIESSGWLSHSSTQGSQDSFRFKYILEDKTSYTVFYSIKTINDYEQTSEPYFFTASVIHGSNLKNMRLRIEDNDHYCRENGCIKIYLTVNNGRRLRGKYVIIRSSEKTNYQIWEDLQYLSFLNDKFDDTLIYTDFTIESGVRYKYAFLEEKDSGLRSVPLYETKNTGRYVDLEYGYFMRDGLQLKVSLNQKISSFKHTVLTSKQDTLGSKYPHLVKNGNAYYAEFPVSGTISFQMDEDYTFVSRSDDGIMFKDELIVPREKVRGAEDIAERGPCEPNSDFTPPNYITDYNVPFTIDMNLTHNNIYTERKFREKAEEFLNDFKAKLYRSPTEGNIIVVLQNVSLTPNQILGRMLFDFSATAYEIMENTLTNLDKSGIINIKYVQEVIEESNNEETKSIIPSFGQVTGIYTVDKKPVDIYKLIEKHEKEASTSENHLELLGIKSFSIERMPQLERIMTSNENKEWFIREREIGYAELVEINYMLNNKGIDQIQRENLEKRRQEILDEREQFKTSNQQDIIIFQTDNKNGPMIVAPHKLYVLDKPTYALQLIASKYPLIINYTCELIQEEDNQEIPEEEDEIDISGLDLTKMWGQVAGIFTVNERILEDQYSSVGMPDELPYKVAFPNNSRGPVFDELGRMMYNGTYYEVYKTLNIYEVIQEDIRKQVEQIYKIKNGLVEQEDGTWTNNEITYSFIGLTSLDIEADPGTVFLIGSKDQIEEVQVNKSGRYRLSPMDNLVNYIGLKNAASILINYKALTLQVRTEET